MSANNCCESAALVVGVGIVELVVEVVVEGVEVTTGEDVVVVELAALNGGKCVAAAIPA
jgi:hypothetical protein